MNKADELRTQILTLTSEYYKEAFPKREFEAGITSIPVSGRVFDAAELQSLVDSSLDFWLTTGRVCHSVRKRVRPVFWFASCCFSQLRFFRKSCRDFGFDLLTARQESAKTRRRGNHCCSRFPHNSQSYPSK